MSVQLFSAPEEFYTEHIKKCEESFKKLFPFFEYTILRIFNLKESDKEKARHYLNKMIIFHDLGKLTKKWQENINKNWKPAHAPIGASLLFKILENSLEEFEDLKNAIIFAVTIHHTDRGLLGDNIERPDVRAILEGVIKKDETIDWDEKHKDLSKDFFPQEAENLNIYDLNQMARNLRIWAKGCSLLEQHKRRLQVCFIHHILKLCDIYAALGRKKFEEEKESYFGGKLMIEEIRKYVESKI